MTESQLLAATQRLCEVTLDDVKLSVPVLDGDELDYYRWQLRVSSLLSEDYANLLPETEPAADAIKKPTEDGSTLTEDDWKKVKALWRLLVSVCQGEAAAYLANVPVNKRGNGSYAWFYLRKCFLGDGSAIGDRLLDELRSFKWFSYQAKTELLRFEGLVNTYAHVTGTAMDARVQRGYLLASIPPESSLMLLKEEAMRKNSPLNDIKRDLRFWGESHKPPTVATPSCSEARDIFSMTTSTAHSSFFRYPGLTTPSQSFAGRSPPIAFTPEQQKHRTRIGMVNCDFCKKDHNGGWRYCFMRHEKCLSGDLEAINWTPPHRASNTAPQSASAAAPPPPPPLTEVNLLSDDRAPWIL